MSFHRLPEYFSECSSVRFERDSDGILVMSLHTDGGPLKFTAKEGEGATFNDLPRFAGGIIPGDGVFTLWNYFVGPGRAQMMLLDPKPFTARTAKDLGVVSEIVPDGNALERAKEIAKGFLKKPRSRAATRASTSFSPSRSASFAKWAMASPWKAPQLQLWSRACVRSDG
jgi:hypothetical protein